MESDKSNAGVESAEPRLTDIPPNDTDELVNALLGIFDKPEPEPLNE